MITITSASYAQSTIGTVFGTVADSTGAAIPNASVTLTDVRTGVKQVTTTNGQGEYTYAAAAFSAPLSSGPADTNPYGNEQKNQFFGPANIKTDLSAFKEFPLYEQVRFQFRAEAFNAFGNVNLNNPRTGLTNIQTVGLTQITGAGPARVLQFAAKLLF